MHRLRALFVVSAAAGLAGHPSWADAPLDPTWVDLRITACESKVFTAPWYALFDDNYKSGEAFETTYVEGVVHRSGTLKNPEQAQPRPPMGEHIALSAPELPPGFCKSAMGKIKRFTYTNACDTLEKKGRCLPSAPDARLADG